MFCNKIILFSPFQFITTKLIASLASKFGLPYTAVTLITSLFHNSMFSIRNVGVLPTLRVLRGLRGLIRKGYTKPTDVAMESTKLGGKLNIGANQAILGNCLGPLMEILQINHIGFGILYEFFYFGFILSLFKPLIMKLVRCALGLILSSVGVVLNEVLVNIPYLSDFADYVVTTLETHTNFREPRLMESAESVQIQPEYVGQQALLN